MSESQPIDAVPADLEAQGEFYLARGEAHMGDKAFQAAFDDYLLAEKCLGADDPRVSFGLSMARMSLQEERKAQREAARLRENPLDVQAAIKFADARRRNGKVQEALDAITQALAIAPQDPRLHYELGLTVQCWVKDPGAALAHFDRALGLKPDYLQAISYRAIARRDAGRADLAIDDYSRLQELAPDYPNLYENRAFAFKELGDFARAESDFSAVLQQRPDQHFYLTERGLCRLELNQHEAALADFTRSLELRQAEAARWYEPGEEVPDERDPESLRGRAMAYVHLNRLGEAREDFLAAATAFRRFSKEAEAAAMTRRADELAD